MFKVDNSTNFNQQHSLSDIKKKCSEFIDQITSLSILAGFDIEMKISEASSSTETLHFSYDSFDQQNFADSAIAMQLGATFSATSDENEIPTSTSWNAYRNYNSNDGGELVVLTLTAETFLPIYAAALSHKASKMKEGSIKKELISQATSIEEIKTLFSNWDIVFPEF